MSKFLEAEYWSEIYCAQNVTSEMWEKNLRTLLDRAGEFRSIKILVYIDDGKINYYLGSSVDFSSVTNGMEKIALSGKDMNGFQVPNITKAENFIKAPDGENLLTVREKIFMKRGKQLNWVFLSLRKITQNTITCRTLLGFRDQSGVWSGYQSRGFDMPSNLLSVDFQKNERFAQAKAPRYLDIKRAMHVLNPEKREDSILEVNTVPYKQGKSYLSLKNYDFFKHSLIIGATGSGKSKFISILADKIQKLEDRDDYRIVVIDPHASLDMDLRNVSGSKIIAFRSRDDGPELFAESGTDSAATSELTCRLLQSLLANDYTPKLDRILRFSLQVLMTARVMTLPNLRRLLTDFHFRMHVVNHVKNHVPESTLIFFEMNFDKINPEVIQPIVDLIEEMELQSGGSVSSGDYSASLAQLVASNPLTVFSLNKIGMGEKVVKAVSGLLISQLFLLAQSRSLNKKIMLIIDEVSVVQNPTIAQILAEARKYNMTIVMAQQFFGQVDKELQNAIFSNVMNYYIFKVSESDARTLEGNVTIELPKRATMQQTRIAVTEQDIKLPFLTELDQRECIVRVVCEGKILPAMKAKTVDFGD